MSHSVKAQKYYCDRSFQIRGLCFKKWIIFNFLVKSFSRKILWKFNLPHWVISSNMSLLFLKSQSSAILPTLSQAKRPKNRQNFIVAELGKVQDDLVMAVLCSWQSSSSNSEASSSKIVNVTCCRTFA